MDWDKKLDEILLRAKALIYSDRNELDNLRNLIELYDEKLFGDSNKYGSKASSLYFSRTYSKDKVVSIEKWESIKNSLINLIECMIEDKNIRALDNSVSASNKKNRKKVFLVHGHDEKLKFNISDWLRSIELDPIVLHLQPNGGLTSILNKIEKYSDVGCAIILFTADDEGKSKKEQRLRDRARQNVIFEAGYFIGKLGADRVVLLYQDGIEKPSDLDGYMHISADEYGGWKDQLRKELSVMKMEFK